MANSLKELTDLRVLPSDPSGTRLWVVSSIDGNLDKIEESILEIETHRNFCENDKVIFMGNFLGNGLDNKEIISLLKEYQKSRPKQVIILRGAEEHKLIRSKKSFFTDALGFNTLHSYKEKDKNKLRLNLTKFIEDRTWLSTLPSIYYTNRFCFVHSGVVVGTPLEKQNPLTTMFLFDAKFLQENIKFSKVIVHVGNSNEYKSNRISVNRGIIVLNDTDSKEKIFEINT